MIKKSLWTVVISLFAFCSTLAQAQGLTDNFTGTTINTANWAVHPGNGAIAQNGILTLSQSQANKAWNSTFVTSVPSFPRTNGTNVLQVTFDYTIDGIFLAGIYPAGSFSTYYSTAFGFHYDGTNIYGLPGQTPSTGPNFNCCRMAAPKVGSLRITLDAVLGARWDIDMKDGNGWTLVDRQH